MCSRLCSCKLQTQTLCNDEECSGINGYKVHVCTVIVFVLDAADLVQLDAMVRMKLSKLLDPVNAGSDWRELAAQLGFSQLIGVCELQRNPTLTVLDSYEVSVVFD